MTTRPPTIRPADADDIDRVAALLAANDLPHRDVRSGPACVFVALDDGAVVGSGGLERRGSSGLLRSVVVERSARGCGVGSALCDHLEDHATGNGVETLFLLTTTAREFFRRRGYDEIDREAAPPDIRATTEFRDLCPASATCMRKDLE